MSGRHRTIVAALFLLGILALVLLVAFAGSACPVETEQQPCPDATRNLVIGIGLAAAAVGLLVTPFAFLGEFVARRRIVYRGAWARAARRGLLVALVVRRWPAFASPVPQRADRALRAHPCRRGRVVRRPHRHLTGGPMTDPAVADATAAVLPDALDLSHRVHANPEIAFEEVQASRWTAELLERHGFEVTAPAGGLDTAFVARWRGDRPGPVIAYAGEYDALPEIGHGCGHNLMCSSSAGAAIAAAGARPRLRRGDPVHRDARGGGRERQGPPHRRRPLRRRRRLPPDPSVGLEQRRGAGAGGHRGRRHLPRQDGPRQRRPVAREERARRDRAAVHDGRPVAAAPEAWRAGARDHHPRRRGAEHRPRPDERALVPAHPGRRGPRRDGRALPSDGRCGRTGHRLHRRAGDRPDEPMPDVRQQPDAARDLAPPPGRGGDRRRPGRPERREQRHGQRQPRGADDPPVPGDRAARDAGPLARVRRACRRGGRRPRARAGDRHPGRDRPGADPQPREGRGGLARAA